MDKLEELRKSIKAKLDEAKTFAAEGKLDESKKSLDEAKALRVQADALAEVIKAQEDEAKKDAELKATKLEAENAALKADAKKPVRMPFEAETEDKKDEGVKSFIQLKYGEVDAATKAVANDLYGFDVNARREAQMKAFVKYVRFGAERLLAPEHDLLHASAKNIILTPELIRSEIKAGKTVAELKATLEEASNDLGGFLVPEDYRSEIIKRLMGVTMVRGKARVVTTTRDSIEWPRLEGGNAQYTSAVRVTWVDETPSSASVAESNPTFGMIRIPIHTVMARTNLSRNLLEDSGFNLLDIMAGLFADAMAIDEDNQFLTGSGANRPYGVLGDLANGAQQSPVAGVTLVTTGDTTGVTADGIVNLVYSLPSQYRTKAVHVLARTTLRDVRKLKDGESRYVWQAGITAGQPQTLMGYAAYESEGMPTVATNNYVDVFGDWGNGFIIADRVGMTVERIVDSTTIGQNQVALFARRRLGGQVVAPWAFAALQIAA